ncbi:MAG TPA: indole-3-glycerol phosphate synthase TrpC [Gemmatimonadales bacterium]|jgi:indole-3-glycerol phosphate synthase|nr:indole-3-glycerol phosphate synthase TrpC [Gemmatimonadales bacterium]
MPVTLDQILISTRDQLPGLRRRRSALEREARDAAPPPSFAGALRRQSVAVIAEVKRRSPSSGTIRDDLDPGERASRYARHGAAAISVLTDGPFFGGSVDDLRTAATRAGVPVLRKDFILDELQIVEARAAGAAAVLLIVRALEPTRLELLLATAREYGLDALVEVHTPAELERALSVGAGILGINSRDLDSFAIDTAAAWRVIQAVPADRVAVAESGMASVADVERAAAAGADAVLIGTALSAALDPDGLMAGLCRIPRHAR